MGLNASSDNYHLTREQDGKRVEETVDLLMPLYEHDILWMSCLDKDKEATSNGSTDERVRMTLQVADGEKEITCEDSPYTLTKKEPYSVISNITESLKEVVLSIFKGLNDQHQRAQLVSLATRGQQSPLFMPLIGQSGAWVAEGDRDLYLSWRGGSPPYAVCIREEGADKPLVKMSMLEETRVHIKSLPLITNKYKLEIEDARSQQLIRHFHVVTFDHMPVPPGQVFAEVTNTFEKQLRETLLAAWLSEQDPPMWSFEAYQRVVDIAPKFYPAELLRLRLEGKL
ncbi:MAG: hypothetical protein PVJ68_17510 [Candidatus Thiodiazotropha sp.]